MRKFILGGLIALAFATPVSAGVIGDDGERLAAHKRLAVKKSHSVGQFQRQLNSLPDCEPVTVYVEKFDYRSIGCR